MLNYTGFLSSSAGPAQDTVKVKFYLKKKIKGSGPKNRSGPNSVSVQGYGRLENFVKQRMSENALVWRYAPFITEVAILDVFGQLHTYFLRYPQLRFPRFLVYQLFELNTSE